MKTPGYVFEPMSEEAARAIAGWRCDPPYDFYDAASDPGDLEELLDSGRREGTYFSAFDEEGALVGFLQLKREGKAVEVGLGLRPALIGRGLGPAFLTAGPRFARRRFTPVRFRISVATFNGRAIRVHERAGFRRDKVSTRYTNSGEHPFLPMTRQA